MNIIFYGSEILYIAPSIIESALKTWIVVWNYKFVYKLIHSRVCLKTNKLSQKNVQIL